MLESMVQSSIIYYVMGGITVVGIVCKVVVGVTLSKLVKAASIMPKSTHSFMKLVRAKFEHACMVNHHVENIEVFVDKYIHEYYMMGIRLYAWQRGEHIAVILLVLVTSATAVSTYYSVGFGEMMLQKTGVGLGLVVFLMAICQTANEKFRLETMKMYMIDYLQNVCARRYEKDQAMKIQLEQAQKEKVQMEKEQAMKEQLENEMGRNVSERKKDSSEILEEQMASIEASVESRQEVNHETPQEEEIRPTLSMVEKLLLEEAERRNEGKKRREEENMPNEAVIREILQEFMA